MISRCKKSVGVVLRRMIPPLWVRTLKNPVVLPSYYRQIVPDIEPIIDLNRRLEWLDDDYWAAILRKQAHILDKGLWACNFEPGRGRDYYNSAIEAYKNIRSDTVRNDPSVLWAAQKIKKYEQVQKVGVGCQKPLSQGVYDPTAYDRLVKIIKSRRSIRSFTSQTIDCQILEKIIGVTAWAPSSCNKQTVKVFATISSDLAHKCLNTCKGGTCFSDSVPCFLSFTADLRSYVMPEEAWLPQIDTSLAAQNSCLAAHTLGLSLCLLTWCQHNEQEDQELRTLLSIPNHHRIVFNAVLGYPSVAVETPERKSLNNQLVLI